MFTMYLPPAPALRTWFAGFREPRRPDRLRSETAQAEKIVALELLRSSLRTASAVMGAAP